MNGEEKPNYYAIIPADVRYCKELKFAERLLYGEITALTNRHGYCFATNKYFAKLFEVIPNTISRWISHLESLGFIKVVLIRSDKKQILERRIYIKDIAYKEKGYKQFGIYPNIKKNKDNNINIKIDRLFNIILNRQENIEEFSYQEVMESYQMLEKFELNYTRDIIKIFSAESTEKIKMMIYSLRELYKSSKRPLVMKINRKQLINIYDCCKRKEEEYKGTESQINSFFEYYYHSVANFLEKD